MDIGVDIGLVYHIDDAHQFWAELEDTLNIPDSCTLSQLDGRLRLYISLCSTYHQQYLPTQLQLEHACCMLLDSELFAFHSERMSNLLLADAAANSNPHAQLILHKTLLMYGRRHQTFLRSQKKWAPLLDILMDHILVDVDFEQADSNPIEAMLITLAVGILYEVCRVQKFDIAGLRTFSDAFLDRLFDLVEETRYLADETLNYSLIKLILALNEQFMVAALPPASDKPGEKTSSKTRNRVLQALVARSGASKTFAENIIFMLNRADSTNEEDVCMQLLVLKILYLLFTTAGTYEYFYTNDLCVLVDVFLRELANLPDESESLRHTYLRVLHPLLTNTQLRETPYKRLQIVGTLRELVDNANIREVSQTTRRLVQRCLGAEWTNTVQQDRRAERRGSGDSLVPGSPTSVSSFAVSIPSPPSPPPAATQSMLSPPGGVLRRDKSLRTSASASDLKTAAKAAAVPTSHNGSMVSLAAAQPRGGRHASLGAAAQTLRANEDASSSSSSSVSALERPGSVPPPVRQRTTSSPYRPPPPPPPGARRRAPAPPLPSTSPAPTPSAAGHTITTIARSRPAPAVSS